MRVFADRFLIEDGGTIDLATGELVRLTFDGCLPAAALARRREVCDRLATLRHALLLPLLDYGTADELWFEAHAVRPPMSAGPAGSRQLALHLVRFLRAHGVALDAADCARHVRPAVERSHGAGPRPLGWRLVWRAALDAVRITLDSGGPPGVTAVTLSGPVGCGLRSARVLLARAARLAGFAVADSRFALVPQFQGRHCCVLDWLPPSPELPSLLAHASTSCTCRHLWLRFTREPVRGTTAVPLDPLSSLEMTTMLYRDREYGPAEDELRVAVRESRGWPGPLIQRLTRDSTPARVQMVHEISPRYDVGNRPESAAAAGGRQPAAGGIRRLLRVLEAAEHVAARGRHARAERLLRRSVDALAARGASAAAARGWVALGDLLTKRGRLPAALAAYERARDLQGHQLDARVILAIGRVHALNNSRLEAEAAFRGGLAHGDPSVRGEAAARLGELLFRAREYDEAAELVRIHGAGTPLSSLLMARIHRQSGDFARSAASARAATGAGASEEVVSEAQIVLARLHQAMGETAAAKRAAADAIAAARRSRDRPLHCLALAACAAVDQDSARIASRRRRLLALASRLPAARADDLRDILAPPGSSAPSVTPEIDVFDTLLGLTEAAADDERAIAAVVRHVHESLGAYATAAWTAEECRLVTAQGRPWPGAAIARLTANSGRPSFTAGVVTEAGEPVRAGGRTVGCISARWAGGRAPAEARARGVLRLAAAAIGPAMLALNTPPRAAVARTDAPDALLGCGPAAERLRALIARAAAAPFPVLIEGESGSGKELVARAIHARSQRRGRRFCAVNCAALTDDLLEAELFGHARGAFTGAASERAGLFEEADQGTLFLDEAAELSARAQAKLLRVLQEGEVRRVGENLPRRVDVRIVSATNRPLEGEVEAGRFRADLRFRLDVIRMVVPPLRDRADEIPALAERIWREAAARVGTRATLGPDLMLALARYAWPGNVRELQNVLAALAVHAPARGRVSASLLPARVAETAGRSLVAFDEARVEFERRFVQAALARAAGRKGLAAAQLGVSRQGLNKMLKRLGLHRAV